MIRIPRRRVIARLKGKRVLITGGVGGIGLATAKRLMDDGARVMVTGHGIAGVAAARDALGSEATVVQSDTASLDAIGALADQVRHDLGGLDALMICAGQTRFVAAAEMDQTTYDELQAVNARGAFFTMQTLVPLIADGGAIVVVTSVADVRGMPMLSGYAASKAALRSLVRSFARELLARSIRVNAVSPGVIDSGILEKVLPPEAAQKARDGIVASNPMQRFGTPEEVAAAMVFLAFDATYTTGAELVVDGGATQI